MRETSPSRLAESECVRGETNSRAKSVNSVLRSLHVLNRRDNPLRSLGFTFRQLAKLNPITRESLVELRDVMLELLEPLQIREQWGVERRSFQSVKPVEEVLIIGLSESGIVPSFAMKLACESLSLPVKWSVSSRFQRSSLGFVEPHSHAPQHFLDADLVQGMPAEVWIVEDEITTGRTLQNLVECLAKHTQLAKLRVFSLLDIRSDNDRDRLHLLCETLGVSLTVSSLIDLDGWPVSSKQCCSQSVRANQTTEFRTSDLTIRLVWGEQLSAALPCLMLDATLQVQHVTMSPWEVDGVSIHRRIALKNGYFLYNYSGELADLAPSWSEHV